VIIAYRIKDRAIFLYDFAKNERENIGPDELEELRDVARLWLEAAPQAIAAAIEDEAMEEVQHDEKDKT